MGMDVIRQTRMFLFAIIFGALAAIVFDLFTHTAKLFKHKKLILFILDGIYAILCCISAVLFLLIEGDGRLESYVLFGAVLGACLYFFSVSAFCKRFFNKK